MADELENKPDELDVESQVDDKDTDNKEDKEEFLSPGVSAPGKGVLEKIANVFKKKPVDESVEEDEDIKPSDTGDTVEENVEDTSEYIEIDPKFVEAARQYGWEDNRIVEYAENHSDADVLLMTNLMKEGAEEESSASDDIKSDGTFDLDDLNKLAGDDPKLQAIIKAISPLAKRVDEMSSTSSELAKGLEDRNKEEQLKEDVRNMDIANSVFDESGISSLGKTDDLPHYPDGSFVMDDQRFKERSKVWDVAMMFYATGGTFKSAMNNAIQWYKGESAEKDIKNKVIKDLKEQEERVMPKRSESKTEPVYANDEERKAAIINAAIAKYNKEFPTT